MLFFPWEMWHGILVVIQSWEILRARLPQKENFTKLIYPCNQYLRRPPVLIFIPALPSCLPLTTAPTAKHYLDFLLHGLISFWVLYKWNYIAWAPFCLVPLALHYVCKIPLSLYTVVVHFILFAVLLYQYSNRSLSFCCCWTFAFFFLTYWSAFYSP